jgi:Flp pilus assembly protein TadG
MSAKFAHPDRQRSDERGSIVIMTAIFMLLLFLMVGLCIDVSRIYMVRAELQNAADAAALTGARELNAGTTGIDRAVTQASQVTNTVDFAKLGIRIATVDFARQPDGPYLDADTAKRDENVADIRYVRAITRPANTAILFGIAALGTSHAESRSAVAGMSVGLNGFCDYFPVAIARATPAIPDPNHPYIPFAAHELVTVHFKDNTGTTINLPASTFVVLDTPWVTGNGADETKGAMAGVAPRCSRIGEVLNFSKSPSANAVNGPKQTEDGTNTRFYIYPPGNQLTYDNAKPATNIWGSNPGETLTYDQYLKDDASVLRRPGRLGVFERRLLLVPIILPITNGAPNGQVKGFEYFFLRQAVDGNCPRNGPRGTTIPCPPGTTAAGDILLEHVDKNAVVGRGLFDPTSCSSDIGVAVIYR